MNQSIYYAATSLLPSLQRTLFTLIVIPITPSPSSTTIVARYNNRAWLCSRDIISHPPVISGLGQSYVSLSAFAALKRLQITSIEHGS